jgi:hypothetical protein
VDSRRCDQAACADGHDDRRDRYRAAEATGRQLFTPGGLSIDPVVLVKQLGYAVEGCLWLRDCWRALIDVLESGRGWRLEEMRRFVLLMGKEPLAAIDKPAQNEVFLEFDRLTDEGGRAFSEACREAALREGDVSAEGMQWRAVADSTPRDRDGAIELLTSITSGRSTGRKSTPRISRRSSTCRTTLTWRGS